MSSACVFNKLRMLEYVNKCVQIHEEERLLTFASKSKISASRRLGSSGGVTKSKIKLGVRVS